jgi:hypothetical protein
VHVFPIIGTMSISEIKSPDIYNLIKPLDYYAANVDKSKRKDQAAEVIAGRIAPVTLRKVRGYIAEFHKKNIRASSLVFP